MAMLNSVLTVACFLYAIPLGTILFLAGRISIGRLRPWNRRSWLLRQCLALCWTAVPLPVQAWRTGFRQEWNVRQSAEIALLPSAASTWTQWPHRQMKCLRRPCCVSVPLRQWLLGHIEQRLAMWCRDRISKMRMPKRRLHSRNALLHWWRGQLLRALI